MTGNLWWQKPAQSSGAYASAFSFAMAARGAFLEPVAGEALLEVPQGSAGLSFSTETPDAQPLFESAVTLSAKNTFTVPGKTQKLTLQLDARSGLVRGSFTEPGTGTRRLLEGVILPGVEAIGFFSTGTAAGSWSIRAN